MHEGIPILNFLVPKEFTHENGRLTGVRVREGEGRVRRQGPAQAGADRRARSARSTATTCWSRSARRTPSPGSSATSASSSTNGTCRRSTRRPWPSTHPKVFFGGDAAFGPKNIIWAVAHGHEAAVSIDQILLRRGRHRAAAAGRSTLDQPEDGHPRVELRQRHLARPALPGAAARQGGGAERHQGRGRARLRPRARAQGGRALPQLRRADGVHRRRCASSATPASTSARWTASPSPTNGEEAELRTRLQAPAPNLDQDLYVSDALKTGRVMVKDEDVCLHCGLCAERCPTGAWDMQKFLHRHDPRG